MCILIGFIAAPLLAHSDEEVEEIHDYQVPYVPILSQLPQLPNGCEAVAATMLLNWAGLDVTKEEIAEALPKGDMPSMNDDGAWVGANPSQVFVGDPFGVGFGIFHTPVAELLDQYLPGQIEDLSGSSFNELLGTIRSGRPVMIWATEHMDTPYAEDEWQDAEGNLIEWYEPEHALILTGWNDDYAYLNDPMTGANEQVDLWNFQDVWEAMGSQAITVTEEVRPPASLE